VQDVFAYDSDGRPTAEYQRLVDSAGWYNATAAYYPNGGVQSLSVPGMPAVTYSLDGEGRPVGAMAGSAMLAKSGVYAPEGLTNLTLGSNDSDAYTFDPSTGRMTQYQFTVGGATDTGALTWNANGSLGTLAVAGNIPGAGDTQTCTYTHDDLGRIASAACTGGDNWSQAFSYDALGNVLKSGTQSFQPNYGINNRISTNIGFAPNYDNDGDLLGDPVRAQQDVNAFDAEGHAVTLEGIGVTYDALGRAVEAAEPGGAIEFLYAPGGGKLAVMNGQTLLTAYIPLPGGGTAVYHGATLAYYRHADWLGSSRLASTPGRALNSATAYAPYGEPHEESGTIGRNFTGQNQDIDSSHSGGQYDFLMREYNPIQGRWWTPDPSGLAAVDPNNPQSWNRYAYVSGMPLEVTDPSGLLAAKCEAADRSGAELGCGDPCQAYFSILATAYRRAARLGRRQAEEGTGAAGAGAGSQLRPLRVARHRPLRWVRPASATRTPQPFGMTPSLAATRATPTPRKLPPC